MGRNRADRVLENSNYERSHRGTQILKATRSDQCVPSLNPPCSQVSSVLFNMFYWSCYRVDRRPELLG